MKRLLSVVLSVFMAVSLTSCASATASAPSDWAAAEVSEAVSLGLVPSALQTNYADGITREEFCDTLILLVKKVNEKLIGGVTPIAFSDTNNQNVANLGGMEIVSGVGDGGFNPNGSISRQEAAVMLARAGEKLSGSKVKGNVSFDDAASVADWAADGVSYVTASKVMNGTGTGFDPLGGYTREQTFATVLRLYKFLSAKTAAEQPKTKDEDLDASWDLSAVQLTFDGKTATVTEAGTYIANGNIANGQIVIDNENDELVRLVLSGVNLTNPTGAAIYAKNCDKLLIVLADGTQNTITDGGAGFVYDDVTEEEPNAAIWSKNDLTVTGGGSLTVNAGFNNGIGTKDDLLIVSGNITVNAVNHALKGKDTVTVLDGSLNLSTTEGDGIQTDNTEENGNIFIRGGILNFSVADDGIHADNTLEVSGGKITVTKCYEGLEAATLNILGGDIDITAGDDGLNAAGGNSNGNDAERVMGGGRPADGAVPNAGGTVPQGGVPPTDGTMPADRVPPNGGAMPPTGGTGVQGVNRDSFTASGGYSLNISGGNVTIHAGRDCLDSNGVINISGGHTVLSSDAHNGGDGAIDPDGSVTITGGTVIYDGSMTSGKLGADSTQSYIYSATAIKAGDKIAISKNGKEFVTFTTTLNMAGLAVSAPGVTAGEDYDISINGTVSAVTAGVGGNSMGMGGGRGGMGMPQDGTAGNTRGGRNRQQQGGTMPIQ